MSRYTGPSWKQAPLPSFLISLAVKIKLKNPFTNPAIHGRMDFVRNISRKA